MSHARRATLVLALAAAAAGCRQDMHDQPKYKAFRRSAFFGDERSARPPVEDTVARGQLRADAVYYTGKQGTMPVDVLPVPVTPALLRRGRERFGIYCTPCHDGTGSGNGLVKKRALAGGATAFVPPTFHQDRIRHMPDGQLFATISNGVRNMPAYGPQIPVADRWAIVSYVRALQLSQEKVAAATENKP